ncbi:rCG33231 [Rattus norvegicus]|uniref:RCG33231 n=1 Tax=Rattus norvegicus TaxID=10116 RepID=A6HJL4_RAT|nr:rCG33231 [Rattus norvegicus]
MMEEKESNGYYPALMGRRDCKFPRSA